MIKTPIYDKMMADKAKAKGKSPLTTETTKKVVPKGTMTLNKSSVAKSSAAEKAKQKRMQAATSKKTAVAKPTKKM